MGLLFGLATNGVERTAPALLSAADADAAGGPKRSVLVLLASWNGVRQ
jgi:hypothetical protein